MWWSIGYVALLLYAGTMFTWSGLRERWSAAIGTLLCLAGLQLGLMQRVPPALAVSFAGVGLALFAREATATVVARAQLRGTPAPARASVSRERDER